MVSGGHTCICAPQGDVNIQSFIIIWVKRFSEHLAYEISYRPGCWWGLLCYLSSFISQILDFLYWMVCIFIFMASQWKQRMDYFDDQHTITVPMVNLVLNSCHIYLSHAQKSFKTQQCMKCESCFIVFRTEKGYSKNCPCYNHYCHNFVGQLPVLEVHHKLLVLLCMRLSKCTIINNFC